MEIEITMAMVVMFFWLCWLNYHFSSVTRSQADVNDAFLENVELKSKTDNITHEMIVLANRRIEMLEEKIEERISNLEDDVQKIKEEWEGGR